MTITTSGTTITFNDSTTQNTAATGFGFKNRIINGAMVISQRYGNAAVTNASGYVVDRFADAHSGSGQYTCQQVTTAPTGFSYSVQHTITTAVTPGASDVYQLFQYIEGYNVFDLNFGTANAQTITLSFWVRSSITGTYAVSLKTGASRSYVATYTINSANTFEYKTITIPGDTSGTWPTDNTAWGLVCFDLGSGTGQNAPTANAWQAGDYRRTSGCVTLISTNAATFYVTGVQLEKGPTATAFDYRPYGTELVLCQRYCQGYSYSGTSQPIFNGNCWAATDFYGVFPFPVQMRVAPTTTTITNPGNCTVFSGTQTFPGNLVATGQTPYSGELNVNGITGMTVGRGGWVRANGIISVLYSAEL